MTNEHADKVNTSIMFITDLSGASKPRVRLTEFSISRGAAQRQDNASIEIAVQDRYDAFFILVIAAALVEPRCCRG